MARTLEGIIVSDKMQKTAVVEVSFTKKHPKYLKYYKISNRFKAHNENNEYKTGDTVIISETRPLSKEKRWNIISLVKKGLKSTE
ncbi:MAG: 30S ribosomal protein S17 [Janthinobacterium sp.]|jgi:small subunit ribosomal protein S17